MDIFGLMGSLLIVFLAFRQMHFRQQHPSQSYSSDTFPLSTENIIVKILWVISLAMCLRSFSVEHTLSWEGAPFVMGWPYLKIIATRYVLLVALLGVTLWMGLASQVTASIAAVLAAVASLSAPNGPRIGETHMFDDVIPVAIGWISFLIGSAICIALQQKAISDCQKNQSSNTSKQIWIQKDLRTNLPTLIPASLWTAICLGMLWQGRMLNFWSIGLITVLIWQILQSFQNRLPLIALVPILGLIVHDFAGLRPYSSTADLFRHYEQQATEKGTADICERIDCVQCTEKKVCYMYALRGLAIKNLDPSLCLKIPTYDPNPGSYGVDMRTPTDIDCVIRVAIKKHDENICDALPEHTSSRPGKTDCNLEYENWFKAGGRRPGGELLDENLDGLKESTLVNAVFSNVRVSPNPFHGEHGDQRVQFEQLPMHSTVKILGPAGQLITMLETVNGAAQWPIMEAGQRVPSGIYRYVITDSQGHLLEGQLSVLMHGVAPDYNKNH